MQEPSPYNSHRELRKTITLIAGILLLFVGIFMLYQGTAAAGSVDFKTPLLTGKIETGSAGLLAICFGFFVIYLANHDKGADGARTVRISPIVRMLIQCNQLSLIISFAIILVALVLIYLIEPLRIHLVLLVGLIIILNVRQIQR